MRGTGDAEFAKLRAFVLLAAAAKTVFVAWVLSSEQLGPFWGLSRLAWTLACVVPLGSLPAGALARWAGVVGPRWAAMCALPLLLDWVLVQVLGAVAGTRTTAVQQVLQGRKAGHQLRREDGGGLERARPPEGDRGRVPATGATRGADARPSAPAEPDVRKRR
jgi:hypothetical protein